MDEKCRDCPYIGQLKEKDKGQDAALADHEDRIYELEKAKAVDNTKMDTMVTDIRDIKKDLKELTKIPGRLLVAAGGSVITAVLLAGLIALKG